MFDSVYRLPLSKLVSLDAEIQQYQDHCEELLETRQRDIHTVNRRMNGESKTLTQEYLYRDLSVSFPVLTTTLDCLNSLDEIRSSLIAAACVSR